MNTAAIIPDFHGFEWDVTPFSPESTFDNILSQFEQDPVFLNPLCQGPGCHIGQNSPIPKLPLTHLPLNPSSSELHKKEKGSSCITNNRIGNDGLRMQIGEGMQSKHPIQHLDSSWVDMSQAKALPPALTAGLLERRNSTMSTEGSILGLEKSATHVKMRSASRRPKKVSKKPALPAHVVQARECHNNVEKQYRTRLKQKFERLLAVLQASKTKDESGGEGDAEAPDCGYSRGEVLNFARQRILTLEEENRHLSDQVQNLKGGFTIV
ncbi:hypothetical protein FPSE_09741 [Fusarium pseudograminearum CS3096]|uniref:Uncharacterized protein n=1 Tax=Fusarium pseudograminearum (strain CS3096) TaxID=1028729 RepID=K3UEM0_FUSPC|nr:hypothetical protein FPSE_09741 [Fusarium pseudograminearum CS3096]EKJ70081.1 hypothetical protein FPSE_09741 [Fusarium pseudograminearum CS3096]KAF0635195.1 hypothetical protein FPSE5266_09741 [Fusarium pseudograminearum]